MFDYIEKYTLVVLFFLCGIALFCYKIDIKPIIRNGSIVGTISGVLGGLFSMSRPPLVLYYLAGTKDMTVYSAYFQAVFVISNIYSIILNLIVGNITSDALVLAIIKITKTSRYKIHEKQNKTN